MPYPDDLHIWCSVKEMEVDKEKKDQEIKDKEAGMLVIRNCIHCIKHGQSAEDFVYLNSLNG